MIYIFERMAVRYTGKCPWMEDVETVANLVNMNGRPLVEVIVSSEIKWKYWYLDEFFSEWKLI